MQALCELATNHTALLSRYGTFLANILDHLESFSDEQLKAVFDMFAALTASSSAAGNTVTSTTW